MVKHHLGSKICTLFFLCLLHFFVFGHCQSHSSDASIMQALKLSLGLDQPGSLDWTGSDPCNWQNVGCSNDGRVIEIKVRYQNLQGGSLPSSLANLTALQTLDVASNDLSGPLPSLHGMNSLQNLLLSNNSFSFIPSNFFLGMTTLENVYLDNISFSDWPIPDSLRSASTLKVFSANNSNINGKIPDYFGANTFPNLTTLHLEFNNLEGGLPASFSDSTIQSLRLHNQRSIYQLNGSIVVIQNMTHLTELWLHDNSFSGPLPDISGLTRLQSFTINSNYITGQVPTSLMHLPSLKIVNLTNNLLQGPTPNFDPSVVVDINEFDRTNSFCLSSPGVECDPRVNTLLSIVQSVNYPIEFAKSWKGNDPCILWLGLTCTSGDIIVVNFQNMDLTGTISPNFSSIPSLRKLILANNNLIGTIPNELTTLPNLRELDVSNNRLYGEIPLFKNNVIIKTDGNLHIWKNSIAPSPGTPKTILNNFESSGSKYSIGVIIGIVIGGVCVALVVGIVIFYLYRGRIKYSSKRHVIEVQSMVISIHVLKNATNNFSQENILGRGGFGTVYKGELHDGTKIAVKRMESGMVSESGWDQFKSEIVVLNEIQHRHLVSILGYCLDGNERLLVYEYMPQGTLSRHLFQWKEEGLNPLEWLKRLTIALDVARGVEYLHSLAHQSFIHRDLKPSNILLTDDMRAKVADFGLVRLAPDGKSSVLTKLAGTFGYLAPEYAVTGRVTVKIDVFSFGVILLQLITGRKAVFQLEPQHDECIDLVTWFRRIRIYKDSFQKAIDPTIDLDEETLASINTVAELASQCCAKKPLQRPDMAHVVNVLSSLVELWKPLDPHCDEGFGSFGEIKPTHHSHTFQNEWPQFFNDTTSSSRNFGGSPHAQGLKVPPSVTW
ncbi:unnamed protein product [Camellia sinensis]